MNKVILCGNLGGDAELRFTQGGQPVSSMSVCTTEKWNDQQGKKQERSEWHSCVWWGKGAEALNKYLTKGKKVLVEGKIQTRSWEDKDGTKRYKTEINITNVELLSSNQNSGGQQRRTEDGYGYNAQTGEVAQDSQHEDDDIPF